jgi:hypothetical protein
MRWTSSSRTAKRAAPAGLEELRAARAARGAGVSSAALGRTLGVSHQRAARMIGDS